MARSDYAHLNEDADHAWWQEEGRFGSEPPPYCDFCGIEHAGDCQYDDDEGDDDEDEPGPFDDEPHIAEDAHLEAAYEDRFAMEDE